MCCFHAIFFFAHLFIWFFSASSSTVPTSSAINSTAGSSIAPPPPAAPVLAPAPLPVVHTSNYPVPLIPISSVPRQIAVAASAFVGAPLPAVPHNTPSSTPIQSSSNALGLSLGTSKTGSPSSTRVNSPSSDHITTPPGSLSPVLLYPDSIVSEEDHISVGGKRRVQRENESGSSHPKKRVFRKDTSSASSK